MNEDFRLSLQFIANVDPLSGW